MEIVAYRSYGSSEFEINFRRTKTGLEVDFVLGAGKVALEVKGASRVDRTSLKGLSVFMEEYSPKRCIVTCNEKKKKNSREDRNNAMGQFLARVIERKYFTLNKRLSLTS